MLFIHAYIYIYLSLYFSVGLYNEFYFQDIVGYFTGEVQCTNFLSACF